MQIFNPNRRAEGPTAAGAEPISPCPYPGLAYFGQNDADLFFGRDAAIARLTEALSRQSFTVLAGASGSGKSSVVLAGLAPNLHRTGNWRFNHFRIGTELEHDPFMALARALVPLYVDSDSDTERLKNTKQLATSLRAGELTLRDIFAGCRSGNKAGRILLIADQFEEAFTLITDDALRHQFIDALLAGFPDPVPGAIPDICLILTLRADFYGQALSHRPFADALQGHVENLGPMNRNELRQAIVRPAENAKVSFDPGLVETLLDAVESKPGGLPLLQFALREMWRRQEKQTVTWKSYDSIGRVEGALAQRAEAIFTSLTNDGADAQMEQTFQRLFTRLVTLGEGQDDTRRVVERQELGDAAWSLAQRLAGEDNRLVVTNAPGCVDTAEIVHEALIRHWPRLAGWISSDRAFQSRLRQIKPNVELWSAGQADDGMLLRGGMLAQAKDWLGKRRDCLSRAELGFIEASVAASERQQHDERRVRRIIWALLAGIIAGLLGWNFQSYIKEAMNWMLQTWPLEQIRWHWVMGGKPLTAAEEQALADQPLQSFTECTRGCPEMVVIRAGKFIMGSPESEEGRDESPQHEVRIPKPFAVGKFTVTFAQWDMCWRAGACPWADDRGWGRDRRPVINENWNDAQAYVKWLSRLSGKTYRLLTEAEWEYAARAGTATKYYWGDNIGKGNANCKGCGSQWDGNQTAPVGSFKPNDFELYDMHGNAWQWVEDCYKGTYENAPKDGSAVTTAGCGQRVLRGGSWLHDPRLLRVAYRNYYSFPVNRYSVVGFRVARTFTP